MQISTTKYRTQQNSITQPTIWEAGACTWTTTVQAWTSQPKHGSLSGATMLVRSTQQIDTTIELTNAVQHSIPNGSLEGYNCKHYYSTNQFLVLRCSSQTKYSPQHYDCRGH